MAIFNQQLINRKATIRDKDILWILQTNKELVWSTRDLARKLGTSRELVRGSITRIRLNNVLILNRGAANGYYYLASRAPIKWLHEDILHRVAYNNTITHNTISWRELYELEIQRRTTFVNDLVSAK